LKCFCELKIRRSQATLRIIAVRHDFSELLRPICKPGGWQMREPIVLKEAVLAIITFGI
jgi:hypothetical protein